MFFSLSVAFITLRFRELWDTRFKKKQKKRRLSWVKRNSRKPHRGFTGEKKGNETMSSPARDDGYFHRTGRAEFLVCAIQPRNLMSKRRGLTARARVPEIEVYIIKRAAVAARFLFAKTRSRMPRAALSPRIRELRTRA